MLTLGLKMMGTNNIVYQLTIWILHGQLIILFINSTDCNNLNTFFTLCLPGSRLNDEMLLLFFHLYTSERDPQDQVILAGWGGGVFVLCFEICIAPLMTTTIRVTLSAGFGRVLWVGLLNGVGLPAHLPN